MNRNPFILIKIFYTKVFFVSELKCSAKQKEAFHVLHFFDIGFQISNRRKWSFFYQRRPPSLNKIFTSHSDEFQFVIIWAIDFI